MAGQFLPEFLRDACIRHCRDETMPETVKAQAGLRTSDAVGFAVTSDSVKAGNPEGTLWRLMRIFVIDAIAGQN